MRTICIIEMIDGGSNVVILDVYSIYYKNNNIGFYYIFEDYSTELKLNIDVDINVDDLEQIIQENLYEKNNIKIIRVPWRTNEKYIVYDGENCIDHSVSLDEEMEKRCIQYVFYKLDDGSYEVELKEILVWKDIQLDEKTNIESIPVSLFELDYKEFLRRVLLLSNASYYKFNVDQLFEAEGLKEFFGFLYSLRETYGINSFK